MYIYYVTSYTVLGLSWQSIAPVYYGNINCFFIRDGTSR